MRSPVQLESGPQSETFRSGALPRFILLYAAMYASYGVVSPFLPAYINSRGVTAGDVGLVLGVATTMRIVAAPVAGRLGDVLRALRLVLVLSTALAAVVTFGYLRAFGLWQFLLLALVHPVLLVPMTVLGDALALGAASPHASSGRRGFEYGWVRGTGSAAFIAGTLAAGQLVGKLGLRASLATQASLLIATVLCGTLVPELAHDRSVPAARAPLKGMLVLLRIPVFRALIVVTSLILGSHAMQDGFAVIHWNAAGIGPGAVSVLWSESVAAEVLVFFVIGPTLVTRLSPARALALVAVGGAVRWIVTAQTTSLLALALVQPMHGLTFALLHLTCMRVITRTVPPGLEGTAQAMYATGAGISGALLVFASGRLYARFEAGGFWFMAALCALPLALTWKLSADRVGGRSS